MTEYDPEHTLDAVRQLQYLTAMSVPVGDLALGIALDPTDEEKPIVVEVVRVVEPGRGQFADDAEAQAHRVVASDPNTPSGETRVRRASRAMWQAFLTASTNGEFAALINPSEK